jgi:putative IMPACT (imprinted ancient) family translation regulator
MLEVLRRQELEGVLATVVRYFGGVKLGAGGLLRAYTDAVAQALLTATKIPLRKMLTLRCAVPYAMEGLVRRELQLAGAVLLEVKHESNVQFEFSATEADCQSLIARFNEAGQGALRWLE